MKSIFLFLLSISLVISCNNPKTQNTPINKQISRYIRENCDKTKSCRIEIKGGIDFSWDRLYVFSEAIEADEISKVLKINYSSSSPNYSRKWFFLKDNQIVRTEEHILYEIDVPVENGDVLLTEDNPQKGFSIFGRDAIFEVLRNKLNDKDSFYYLRCINCPSN